MLTIYSVKLFAAVCITIVSSVAVKISGVIDLGQKEGHNNLKSLKRAFFHNEIGPETLRSGGFMKKETESPRSNSTWQNSTDETTLSNLRVTQYSRLPKPKNLYFKSAHAVKDDKKINEFIYHVYKQSLKVFDSIKRKLDPTLAHRVETLTRNYEEKFQEYLNETLNQKIKTRLGAQRVLLNTISTSNYLLTRLVNYFIADMQKEGVLRNNELAENVLLKEVDKETNLEVMHVCSKFQICRSSDRPFFAFLVSFFNTILRTDDDNFRMAVDALTDAFKYSKFGNIFDTGNRKKLRRKIEMLEKLEVPKKRAIFSVLKHVVELKDKPIVVNVKDDVQVDKGIALLHLLDVINDSMPPNEENKREWENINTDLENWSRGRKVDIVKVMEKFENIFSKNGKSVDVTAKYYINYYFANVL